MTYACPLCPPAVPCGPHPVPLRDGRTFQVYHLTSDDLWIVLRIISGDEPDFPPSYRARTAACRAAAAHSVLTADAVAIAWYGCSLLGEDESPTMLALRERLGGELAHRMNERSVDQ